MIAELLNNISKDNFLAQLVLIENMSDTYMLLDWNDKEFTAEIYNTRKLYSIKISL